MIPKKPVPDLIRDANRFSDKIIRMQNASIDELWRLRLARP
jgi:hypothetical protein